ncbi:MAG TPA: hypothetical protein H9883_06585 [Candidatus Ruthenibacterium merdigallinarum]|nr:hypothetical protein [Candidatus Ruthenibacterium merdigallinarum]
MMEMTPELLALIEELLELCVQLARQNALCAPKDAQSERLRRRVQALAQRIRALLEKL